MKTSVIVSGNAESLQDIFAKIKLDHPKLKFLVLPTKTLEQEFGDEKAKMMRDEASKQSFHLHKNLGDDY